MSFLTFLTIVCVGTIFIVIFYGILTFYRIARAGKNSNEMMERILNDKQAAISTLPKVSDLADPGLILSQVDIVEDYNQKKVSIGNFEWYRTKPINALFERLDLPTKNTALDRIYEIAQKKSEIRKEMGPLSVDDGRHCPVDHIVTENQTAQTCPICGRKLLWFGWE